MGFCLFNNVAVAARHALDALGLSRILILDWDVHHGNGTEAIFATSPQVLYASIHGWPLYPGTGAASFGGEGDGRGYTVNLPVPAGSGDAAFVSLVAHVVEPIARAWSPELVLISAGFDAHLEDPLASCAVTDTGYAAMAALVRRFASELGAPVGVVLEGGYELDALARSFALTLEVVGNSAPPPEVAVDVHPLAADAAERLQAWWPSLGPAASRAP
jgi:acetoin utilization deacetylase AcuC-like enzyme